MTVNEKVEALRREMAKHSLDAYLVRGSDPHDSEYVSERWRSRSFISGFTGSAGIVIITMDEALIWVDSRYFVQCAQQIGGTCFEMRKLNGPDATSYEQFLASFKEGARVGIASETLMMAQKRKLTQMGINLVAGDDLLDCLWTDRPQMPATKVVKLATKLCGESPSQKIERIRESLKEDKADCTLISSLDDIAWTLNMRANDIEDTPVFLSYLFVSQTEVRLFTCRERFSEISLNDACFTLHPYEDVSSFLSTLRDCTIRLNPVRTNMKIYNALDGSVKVQEGIEYTTLFKACKNTSELNGMRVAHLLDGVALVNFLGTVKSKQYSFTELSIAQCLSDERSLEEEYLGPSFSTIAGFAEHGAVVHYSATPETDKAIEGDGLLVLDSGGQYVSGTTDVTRTLLFGKPTKEQIEDYTRVLKGHLALASLVFPKGTNGHQIDAFAHYALWQKGMDYFHGTGHGVGFRLSVHEGPQNISAGRRSAEHELKVGMILSDEPGVYKEGKHGIRIENLVAVVPAFTTEFGEFYTFEVLTCCPYERALIDKKLLSEEEIRQVDTYHAWVYGRLSEMVNKDGLKYLKEATKPL